MAGQPQGFTDSRQNSSAHRPPGGWQPGKSRNLTSGVSELKSDVGVGYRVYFTQRGNVLIILLSDGSKATQQADIRKAQAMVKQL